MGDAFHDGIITVPHSQQRKDKTRQGREEKRRKSRIASCMDVMCCDVLGYDLVKWRGVLPYIFQPKQQNSFLPSFYLRPFNYNNTMTTGNYCQSYGYISLSRAKGDRVFVSYFYEIAFSVLLFSPLFLSLKRGYSCRLLGLMIGVFFFFRFWMDGMDG